MRERSLTIAQAKVLLNELPLHQRSTVLLALTTELRLSNVVKLKWSQVNLELRHAWVKVNESKNRKPIAIPLNNLAFEVLQKQLGNHPDRIFTYLGKPFEAANTKLGKMH